MGGWAGGWPRPVGGQAGGWSGGWVVRQMVGWVGGWWNVGWVCDGWINWIYRASQPSWG